MKGGLREKNIKKTGTLEEPLISIITVVLNGAKHLEETIASVRNQTYGNIEYIIIDGGSTDGTLEIIRKNEDSIDYWESAPDDGIYFAMNKGIVLANGELIGILNADDYYLPDTVKRVVEANDEPRGHIYYGDMRTLLPNGQYADLKPDLSRMDEKPSVFHPTCFVAKTVYTQAGMFDTRYKISADYEFLLRCIRRKMSFHYIPQALTVFRTGGMSASCYSNVEGYHIMKQHKTGYHNQVIWRGIKCYVKAFLKKIINLGG